jgi:hypothetical protein
MLRLEFRDGRVEERPVGLGGVPRVSAVTAMARGTDAVDGADRGISKSRHTGIGYSFVIPASATI